MPPRSTWRTPLELEVESDANVYIAKLVEARELEITAIAPFVTPEPLRDYDLIVHLISGAQSMGDPKSVECALLAMWRTSMELSPGYGEGLRAFR